MREGPAAVEPPAAQSALAPRKRLAFNVVFFSLATGLSRVVGLAREIIAASYFGVSGAMSAFTIAWQVPNLVRALFADWALQSTFIPVFSELIEKGRRREAFRAASALFTLISLVLGAATAIFVLLTPVAIPLLAPGFGDRPELEQLTVDLARIMFPIVPLLALSGLIVGILNSLEHFAVPALAPVAWNLVVIGALLALPRFFAEEHEIYAYAIGILVATVVQFAMPIPLLRGRGALTLSFEWRNPHVVRVLKNALPVTLSMGVMNFNVLLNSLFGTLVGIGVPAAIDKAFRIYTLPFALFSEALATILFPTLSKLAAVEAFDEMRRTVEAGIRQLCLVVFPSAVLLGVLAEPITRLVYERGAFGAEATDLVAEAMLFWSFSLPFDAINFFLARALYGLQRTWLLAGLTSANLVVNAGVTWALYKPFGIGGIILGTVAGMIFLTVTFTLVLRPVLGGLGDRAMAISLARLAGAASLLGASAHVTWRVLDLAVGQNGLAGQALTVSAATAAGVLVYLVALWTLRAPELGQVRRVLRRG